VLQCVAVCCSVLQCVAVCCSVLQCVAVCCNVLQCVAVCCSVLQCVALVIATTSYTSSTQMHNTHACAQACVKSQGSFEKSPMCISLFCKRDVAMYRCMV